MMEDRGAKWLGTNKRELLHALRTTVAAVVSLLIGQLFRLPEAYWAAITTIVVMQSTLGAAWTTSRQRLAGTAIGAVIGAVLASFAGSNAASFGAGVLVAGIFCALLRIERNAFRYAGITVAIVVLVAHTESVWNVAFHRFIEISIGIAVGLILTAVWPEAEAAPAA
jgi:uncharacterized membrane protein YccC